MVSKGHFIKYVFNIFPFKEYLQNAGICLLGNLCN